MVNACSLLLQPPAKVIYPLWVDVDAVMKYAGATVVRTRLSHTLLELLKKDIDLPGA